MSSRPLALIVGLPNPTFSPDEIAFFREADPLGLILARRNMKTPDQTRRLCDQFREAVGRADAPIMTDQEGGRVSHLDSGAWPLFRAFRQFGCLAERDRATARAAIRKSSVAMARMMLESGLDVSASPVLDLLVDGADPVIGERAFSGDPEIVAEFGREVIDGFLSVGLMPIIKHIPGHGRATEDSHKTRPVVSTSAEELDRTDFAPFAALRDAPWAMVSHVVYSAFDAERPASVSPLIIDEVIRKRIGYEGVLISDCIFMNSLAGTLPERVAAVLEAGCDIALHVHGDLNDMQAAARAARPMTDAAQARFEAGRERLGRETADVARLHAQVETMFQAA